MTAVLSRLTHVGIAKETTAGTYVAPTAFIPVMSDVAPQGNIVALRDESYRANDSVLQGQYPGTQEGVFKFSTNAYPTELGHLFRAIIGPDTVTAAPTSTTTSSPITAGSTAVALTVAGVPGQTVLVSDGVNPAEARYLVTATTVNAPWSYPHNTAAAATYLTKHVFAQAAFPQPQPPTYSITDFDGVQTLGYTYARLATLGLKIDGKGMIGVSGEFKSFFPSTQTQPSPTFTTLQPMLGWQFSNYPTSLAAAGQITRYESIDFTLAREVDVLHTGDGTQQPRELFAGGLDGKASISALYENTSDWDTFRTWAQTQAIQTFISSGSGAGSALLINFGLPSLTNFDPLRSSKYVEARIAADAVFNATNAGIASVTLWNQQATAY